LHSVSWEDTYFGRLEALIWQDFVFTGGAFTLALALLPTVFADSKPPRITCVLTASVLSLFAGAFMTLSLPVSAAATSLNALVWWVLLVQRREVPEFDGVLRGKAAEEFRARFLTDSPPDPAAEERRREARETYRNTKVIR